MAYRHDHNPTTNTIHFHTSTHTHTHTHLPSLCLPDARGLELKSLPRTLKVLPPHKRTLASTDRTVRGDGAGWFELKPIPNAVVYMDVQYAPTLDKLVSYRTNPSPVVPP